MKNQIRTPIARTIRKRSIQPSLFLIGTAAVLSLSLWTPSRASPGTGGIPEVLKQLAAIQKRLDTIELEQQMTNWALAALSEVTAASSVDVAEHRLGSADRALDATMSWCFKAGGLAKLEPATKLKGLFNGVGGAGINAYANGVRGMVKLETDGGVGVGWEGSAGTEVSICVNGFVLKEFDRNLNSSGTLAQGTQTAMARTFEQEDLLARALVAQTQIRDRLVDNLNLYGADGTQLPDTIARTQTMDTKLRNPLKLLSSLKTEFSDRSAGIPMPVAIRDRLNDPGGLGLIEGISEQLAEPRQLFCDLSNDQSLDEKFRERMAKVCQADGEKIKETIDNVQLLAKRIRNKLPKGKDRLLNLGVNDWKLGNDD